MANSQKDTRKRLLQKSQALRMLLTSGVIRSADVYPLDTKYTGLRPLGHLSASRSSAK